MTAPTLRDVAEALVRWHDSLTWAYCPTCSAEGDHFDTCPIGMARLALSAPAPSEDVAGLVAELESAMRWVDSRPAEALLRRAALALSQRADGWVACSERLPDGYTTVLVSFDSDGEPQLLTAYYEDDSGKWWSGYNGLTRIAEDCVTHWRPLPAPPEQEATR